MSNAIVLRKDEPPEKPEAKLDASIFEEEPSGVVVEDTVPVRWERDLDIARMVYVFVALNAAGKIVSRYEISRYALENK